MASQKRPSQRHGSKYLATASTMDHARHGFLPRHRDTGILDSIGRFFGGDRGAPKRGSGKDSHHAARTAHYGSLPQKSHGRTQDENPVVHFFKNIVTPRTPPPSQGKGRGLSLSRFSWVGDERTSIGFLFRPGPHSPATFVFSSVSVASRRPFLSSQDLSAHSWDRAAFSSTGEMKRGLPFRKGAEGQRPGFGYGGRASDYKSAHKGFKGVDAQGTLSKIFKLGGRDSRSGSPMARR
ncbi:MBP isoform 35 [Pongo abelii]|uniref:Myelin basic protein n=1 Tax=Pongo abelii TaxID=9601 RepID=A0A2J8T7P1_PONAB|nr:MBP isoform 35 [Pongo abelii]